MKFIPLYLVSLLLLCLAPMPYGYYMFFSFVAGGIWPHGIPLLREQQDDSGGGVWGAGIVLSANLQDCTGTGDMEEYT